MNKIYITVSCCIAIGCSSVPKLSRTDKPVTAADNVWSTGNIAAFENKLEALRVHYHIPSIAIGIVNEKKLVVRGGLGFADIKSKLNLMRTRFITSHPSLKLLGPSSSCN